MIEQEQISYQQRLEELQAAIDMIVHHCQHNEQDYHLLNLPSIDWRSDVSSLRLAGLLEPAELIAQNNDIWIELSHIVNISR